MNVSGFKNDCLIDPLVQFVGVVDARISALNEQLSSRNLSFRQADESDVLPEELVDGICTDLAREIKRISGSVSASQRELASEVLTDFTYLLAAWADESLLQTFHERLPGSYNAGVERLLFGTMDAGEQVFSKISLLIGRRSYGDTSLAAAYLLTLSLGFRGQYFGRQYSEQGRDTLARYREQLASMALSVSPKADDGFQVEARLSAAQLAAAAGAHRKKMAMCWSVLGLIWLTGVIGMEVAWRLTVAPAKRALLEAVSVSSATPAATSGIKPAALVGGVR